MGLEMEAWARALFHGVAKHCELTTVSAEEKLTEKEEKERLVKAKLSLGTLFGYIIYVF